MTAAVNLPMLPYGQQSIDDDDVAAVSAALRSEFLTTGPLVEEFERAFAKSVGARFAASCSSGTAGLHMAAIALRLGPGDAVIVPSLTFLATANAVRYVGAEVSFADVDLETGLLLPEQLKKAFAEAADRKLKVRSIFPVHYAGQATSPAALRATLDSLGRADVTIVEDACHAIGTEVTSDGHTNSIGGCDGSVMAVFSTHPVKTLTTGEGGVVTTNDPSLDRRLRRARNHGMVRESAEFKNSNLAFDADGRPNPWYYEMHEPGFNYRASAIHCGLGLSQLAKLPRFLDRRRQLVARYDKLLAPLAPRIRPLGRRKDCNAGWHLYVARIDFNSIGKSRAQVMRALAACGIGTQVHYIPVHLQPYYRERYQTGPLPDAELLYQSLLSLPLFPAMADYDVDRVVTALSEVTGVKS
jgi:UDP-4-amino-4,6-dideoxy-N-acetyl-beta-L-altrosamine transaminase